MKMNLMGVATLGAVLAAGALWGEVLPVKNAQFREAGPNGAVTGWKCASHYKVEPNSGMNGSGALVWERDEATGKGENASQGIKVTPGRSYRFRAQFRTENFKGGGSLCIEWCTATGGLINGAYVKSQFPEGTADWQLREIVSPILPTNAAQVLIHFCIQGRSSGRIVFDDATLEGLDAKPVNYLLSSAYRNCANEGVVTFHAPLSLTCATTNGLNCRLVLKDETGAVRRVRPTAMSVREANFAVRIERLAPGQQPVVCELTDDAGKLLGAATNVFTRVKDLPQRRVYIDRFNRCIVDGQPFFPLGLYGGWGGKVSDRCAEEMADSAFNTVLRYGRPLKSDLDQCQKHNLKMIADFAGRKAFTPDIPEIIDNLKSHPALLAWYVNDERGLEALSVIRPTYEYIVANDPDHPAYTVQNRTFDLREFLPTSDIFGVDPYPVGSYPMTHATKMATGCREETFGALPLWHVPQFFSWAQYGAKTDRFPTLEELRAMCFQEIALGANGLICYGYHDLEKRRLVVDREEADRCWNLMKQAAAEVAEKVPVILSVEPAPKATDVPAELVTRTWRKDGKVWLLACNTQEAPFTGTVRVDGKVQKIALPALGVFFETVD